MNKQIEVVGFGEDIGERFAILFNNVVKKLPQELNALVVKHWDALLIASERKIEIDEFNRQQMAVVLPTGSAVLAGIRIRGGSSEPEAKITVVLNRNIHYYSDETIRAILENQLYIVMEFLTGEVYVATHDHKELYFVYKGTKVSIPEMEAGYRPWADIADVVAQIRPGFFESLRYGFKGAMDDNRDLNVNLFRRKVMCRVES